jgi:hypothetical protein
VVNSSTSFHKLEFIPFYTERLLINETHLICYKKKVFATSFQILSVPNKNLKYFHMFSTI